MPRPRIGHLSLPIRLDPVTGGLAANAQDNPDDLATAAEAALRIPRGTLEHDPDFGAPDLTLAGGRVDVPGILRDALSASDPRVRSMTDDELIGAARRVGVGVKPAQED